MPSVRSFWSLGLSGTTQISHDPRFLGVLNLLVRRKSVFHDIGSGTTTYGRLTEVARTSIVLPPAFLQLQLDSRVYIDRVLAPFGVDRRNRSSFATRILRAAHGLSRLHPLGFHMTAILDLTILEMSEAEDLDMHELMEQLDSESGPVTRGAAKPAILGLKEKVFAAEDRECCSICLEDFHTAEKVTELPCSHVFHRPCIIRWLESSNSCPLCRCQLDK